MLLARSFSLKMLRVAEFYSGIGGWCSALNLSGVSHEVVGAFDINGVANDTYNHNYSSKASSKSIETFTCKFLKKLNADLWVMSPPCQPYTRNNETETRDNNDPRSKSFLKLIELIKELDTPPRYVALENVVGFEESYCCDQFIETLRSLNYTLIQFHLTPTQFGLPNERPRYYCIAERQGSFVGYCDEGKLLTSIPGVSDSVDLPLLDIFLDCNNENASLTVPPSMVLKSSGWCFDIRSPLSRSTSCFTKSYSRYIKGTGSVLLVLPSSANSDSTHIAIESVSGAATTEDAAEPGENDCESRTQINNTPGERQYQQNWWQELLVNHGLPAAEYTGTPDSVRLRFFSPKELTRLFGFAEEFSFPASVPLRKQYELIGNSLNVRVACALLKYLLVKNCSN